MNPTPDILDLNILSAMMFCLLFGTQDDRYEPESALRVIAAITGLDDETCGVTIKFFAMDAERNFINVN